MSEKSSMVRESIFMDTYGDGNDEDFWTMNLNNSHFWVIPILLFGEQDYKEKTGIEKCIDNFLEMNNDVIQAKIEKEPLNVQANAEEEIRLSSSSTSTLHSKPPCLTLDISKSTLSTTKNKKLMMISMDLTIQPVDLWLTVFTIWNVNWLISPISYFYNSSWDGDLENYKQFVHDCLSNPALPTPSPPVKQKSSELM